MIFDHIYEEEWNGKVSNIIKAPRPDRELYDEALCLFHKKKYAFALHKKNDWGLGDMSELFVASKSKSGIFTYLLLL